ncbi:MAG: hypothetical protein Q7J73_04875 [Dehalococcoidales bacterium]|nr:hypothetical protein [Dehalococcoidales bacterium]
MEWLDRILLTGKWAPGQLRPPDGSDAERITASIKDKARSEAEAEASLTRGEAEAEAARIVAQARLEVHEIEVKAEITAREEAQRIISTAKREAAGIEIESRERAFQFLVQTSQEIEREVGEAYRLALSRLSTSMLGLSDESQQIDAELKSKMAKLITTKTWELKEAKTALLSASEGRGQSNIIQDKTTGAAASPKKITGKKARKFLSLGVKIPWRRDKPPVKSEEPAEPSLETSVSAETETNPQSSTPTVSVAKEERLEKHSAKQAEAGGQEAPTLLEVDSQALYTGKVELVILPPVDLKLVSRFYSYLQMVTELRILYTRGSWGQGTTIAVEMEKPVALIKAITGIPDLVVTVGLLEESATRGKTISLFRQKDRENKRLGLILKEDENGEA